MAKIIKFDDEARRALEAGVVDHVPGDGRELVVAVPDAAAVRAEDGRSVTRVDVGAFVTGLPGNRRNAAVVSSLISLSAELGLEVIAEGVETAEQLGALRLMRCPAVQGFLHDRPTPRPQLQVPRPAPVDR